ncbi:MAG: hypothetical protein MZU84_06025 [Sphingobacterium sp.]|nr:hypothetical protein [Sphingobacterium sp.]
MRLHAHDLRQRPRQAARGDLSGDDDGSIPCRTDPASSIDNYRVFREPARRAGSRSRASRRCELLGRSVKFGPPAGFFKLQAPGAKDDG